MSATSEALPLLYRIVGRDGRLMHVFAQRSPATLPAGERDPKAFSPDLGDAMPFVGLWTTQELATANLVGRGLTGRGFVVDAVRPEGARALVGHLKRQHVWWVTFDPAPEDTGFEVRPVEELAARLGVKVLP